MAIIQTLRALEHHPSDQFEKDFSDNKDSFLSDDVDNLESRTLVTEALDYLKSYESFKDILVKGIKDNLSVTLAIECLDVFIEQTKKVFSIEDYTISNEDIRGSERDRVDFYLRKINRICEKLEDKK